MATQSDGLETLELHLTATEQEILQAAATAANQSVSDFILQSALSQAEETLPDRRHFFLNAEQWTAFMAALDAPPRDLPQLRRLLNEPSVFDDPAVSSVRSLIADCTLQEDEGHQS